MRVVELYLASHESLHDLELNRESVYKSIVGHVAFEHTACLNHHIFAALRIAYTIISYIILPYKGHGNLILIWLSRVVYPSRKHLEFIFPISSFITCLQLRVTYHIPLSLWCINHIYFDHFNVNCENKMTDKKVSRPFDRTSVKRVTWAIQTPHRHHQTIQTMTRMRTLMKNSLRNNSANSDFTSVGNPRLQDVMTYLQRLDANINVLTGGVSSLRVNMNKGFPYFQARFDALHALFPPPQL